MSYRTTLLCLFCFLLGLMFGLVCGIQIATAKAKQAHNTAPRNEASQ